MGLSERKQRETEALRQQVLDEAEDIFAREGIQHVTMRRVAARIDYAPTVLYRLFANKNDLLDHLIARGYEGVRGLYAEVLERAGKDPLEDLKRILEVYVEYALDHPNHYCMWFDTGRLRRDGSELRLSHGRLEFVVFQPWLDLVTACTESGLLPERDSVEMFQILWARVHGLISLRIQQPEFPWLPVEQHLTEVLDLDSLGRRHRG